MMSLADALSAVKGQQQQINYLYMRAYIAEEFPNMSKALKLIDMETTKARRPKGFNLMKRENKALGFVYYVRYYHEKRILPSKWCTHTNDYAEAYEFAVKNRNKLIKKYLEDNDNEVDKFFKNYYDNQTTIYKVETARNGEISEARRMASQSFIRKRFVPYLRTLGIKKFEDITVPVLDDLQDKMLAEGMKPQTVNDHIGMISKPFRYLVRKGKVKINPCLSLPALPVKPGDRKSHGCHEVIKMKGVFDKEWDDKLSYILNLIIYTTDMRNGEIRSIRKKDIVEHYGARFVDLKESKTSNGVRLVPLHPFVYEKLIQYAGNKKDNEAILKDITPYWFTKAYKALANKLGVSGEQLKRENITYYSGRHFWKTLMNSEGLGNDIEEVFMGHKVSGDVSKLYNHRDAAGMERVAKKALEVFKILDSKLFTIKAR
jgi:integrase